jgi:hypothetical protein
VKPYEGHRGEAEGTTPQREAAEAEKAGKEMRLMTWIFLIGWLVLLTACQWSIFPFTAR